MLRFDEWMRRNNLTEDQLPRRTVWFQPKFDEERGEFERTAQALNLSMFDLMAAFDKGWLRELPSEIMARIENTDWAEVRPGDLKQARTLAAGYGRNVGSQDTPGTLMYAFAKNEPLPAPIVVKIGSRLYLIAGNTRLMLSRAFNVIPKVWFVELDQTRREDGI